jgi:hypothetical protein
MMRIPKSKLTTIKMPRMTIWPPLAIDLYVHGGSI